MKLPKQITPSPLREAAVEIRFDSKLPSDAVFGVVYSALNDTYPKLEKLPILQIPEAIRNKDENLIFQPHYKLHRENFIAQVGPRVFALSMAPNYTTWSDYRPELLSVFEQVGKAKFISSVSRFGLRYINHFEQEVLKHLDVELKIMDRPIEGDEAYIRTVYSSGDFNILLQIVNSSDALRKSGVTDAEPRSAIDTDVSIQREKLDFFENIEALLNKAHSLQKEIFFGLLKKDFLETMNPQY